ncbi:hypothetical protein BFP76_04635 [Amylibacter kogurei]|uniref:Fatty acid desaturase domain-containing protein n=1 Tax=Paramylibacter kogurei TaxID=1889778 RepID=A0A2G5K719_9RHOB|nr:hypothetical protein [Amylibacter kogurei]PIB24494.1 hypothetical protein BFP76_04635 [Amylibacter kogurei]
MTKPDHQPRNREILWPQMMWRVGFGIMHIVFIPVVIMLCTMLPYAIIPLFLLGFGAFFGLISFANAKKLLRHPNRYVQQLGALIFASLWFGHRASSEILIHQVHKATPIDPNTAKQGESIYQFIKRAWIGSYRAGLYAENKRRMAFNHGQVDLFHPYLKYWLVPLMISIAIHHLMGGVGLGFYIGLSMMAQLITLLCDYVRHYGLRRERDHYKRYLPIQQHHYWIAPRRHGPKNSPHTHGKSAQNSAHMQSPHLPFTMITMMFICLFPRWFQNLMQPRLRDWQRLNRI